MLLQMNENFTIGKLKSPRLYILYYYTLLNLIASKI